MKALQSDLAKKLLADPKTKAQLRDWTGQKGFDTIVERNKKGEIVRRYKPVLVKAAA